MINREKKPLCVCAECLTVGHKIEVRQGSWIVRVSLYMCGIFPGTAYSAWQESTKKNVCPGCKKDSMIPVDTPKGRLLTLDAEAFGYEKSIDDSAPDINQDVGVNIQEENMASGTGITIQKGAMPKSLAKINRTAGVFVICGLILSALMLWKPGLMNKKIITEVDFLNQTYSSAAFSSDPVTLKNGRFIDHGEFGTDFLFVEYTDFNNDGKDEAVVSLGTDVDGSAAYIEDYFVYTYQKGQLKEIFHTARENPRNKIKVAGKTMAITAPHWKPDDPHSSPSNIETTTYGWKDGRIDVISRYLASAPQEQSKELTATDIQEIKANEEAVEKLSAGDKGDGNTTGNANNNEDLTAEGAWRRVKNEMDSGTKKDWYELGVKDGGLEVINQPLYIKYGFIFQLRKAFIEPKYQNNIKYSLISIGYIVNCDNDTTVISAMKLHHDGNVVYESAPNSQVVNSSNLYTKMASRTFCKYAHTSSLKTFDQDTRFASQEQPKELEERDKTEKEPSTDTPQMMVMRMLEYALEDGGLSHELEIQQAKLQIENLPRPEKGNKKAAREINDKGLAAFKDYDFDDAVDLFEEANKLDKSDVEIAGNLGFAYLKQGNLEPAQQEIIMTLSMSPGRATAWENLGEVFGAKGDTNRAIACFSNAYRFSKDRLKTHQAMKKINETEDVVNIKQARAKAIDWAEKSYPNI